MFKSLLSQLQSIWTILQHSFTQAETVQYPEQQPYLSPRYRGRIVLTNDPDGEERCVACNLCAVACPVDCIALQQGVKEDGRWYAEFFRINFPAASCVVCARKRVPPMRYSSRRISKCASTTATTWSMRRNICK